MMQGKSNIKWAMAARSEARLEKVRSDLAKTYPGMKVMTILTHALLVDTLSGAASASCYCSPEGGLIGFPHWASSLQNMTCCTTA